MCHTNHHHIDAVVRLRRQRQVKVDYIPHGGGGGGGGGAGRQCYSRRSVPARPIWGSSELPEESNGEDRENRHTAAWPRGSSELLEESRTVGVVERQPGRGVVRAAGRV